MSTALVIAPFAVPLAACVLLWLCRAAGFRRGVPIAAALGGIGSIAAGAALLYFTASAAEPLTVSAGNWLSIPGPAPLEIPLSLRVDHRAAWLMATVTIIGGLILLTAAAAPARSDDAHRGLGFLLSAIAATCVVISSGNLLQLTIAWQLLGLALCGLASARSGEMHAVRAVRKTALVWAVGGCGLIAATALLWAETGTLDLAGIAETVSGADDSRHVSLAVFGIMVAVTAACAQLPLYVWLPDAAESSRPAAAAIQCVTAGVAGIWLLMATRGIFTFTPALLFTLALLSAITALAAGLMAVAQTHRTRAVAFVTIAHLGLILLAIAAGTETGLLAAEFHVAVHAAAMAVVCLAGSASRPMTLAGAAAVSGEPLLSGYWSLTLLLSAIHNMAGDQTADAGWWQAFFVMAAATILLTAGRLSHLAFDRRHSSAAEQPDPDTAPLGLRIVPLALLTVMALGLGAAVGPWTGWLPQLLHIDFVAVPFDSVPAITCVAAALGGVVVAFAVSAVADNMPTSVAALTALPRREFFLNEYFFLGLALPLRAASLLCRFVDWFLIDRILVGLFSGLPAKFTKTAQPLQNGLIQFYALVMVTAAAMMLAVALWFGGGAS